MKIFLPLLLASLVVLTTSLNNSSGEFSKYHADGIEGFSYSVNPPASKTGAPGEGTCADCHAGSTMSAAGVVMYNFSGANGEYLPDSTYTIDLSIPSGVKNGFEMTILDANDDMAGSFTVGSGTSTTTALGRDYIRHSSSVGVTSWSFDWTAPSSDMGNLTVYYAFNKTNSNGSTLGDTVYLGQETILISPELGLTDYQQLDEDYEVFYDQQNKLLNVTFRPHQYANVVVNIQSLNGQLVRSFDYGNLNSQTHKKQVDLSDLNVNGIYIVSVLIDNYALNRKVYLN